MKINDISDVSYLLPPMTKTTESDSTDTSADSGLYLDYMVLVMEYARSMKREDYAKAADCATQMIEISKQIQDGYRYFRGDEFSELHMQRAHAYAMSKDYNAAANDLQWID